MLKKEISYIDFDGNERTENFYFNLTKAEVTEMEISKDGGLSNVIDKIVKEQDSHEIIEIFKSVIHKAYGEKSLDGRRFVKNEEVLANFTQTEAYSKLFMELATNAEAAVAFINGILPEVPKKQKDDKEAADMTQGFAKS